MCSGPTEAVRHFIQVTDSNNNKFYIMRRAKGATTFTVEYGRVGAASVTKTYQHFEWDKKANEKLKKGYKEVTDITTVAKDPDPAKGDSTQERGVRRIASPVVRDITSRLLRYADVFVQQNYKVEAKAVTRAAVDKAQSIIDALAAVAQTLKRDGAPKSPKDAETLISATNQALLDLYATIPRRMNKVQAYLISKSLTGTDLSDRLSSLVADEQQTLDVMRTEVDQADARRKSASAGTPAADTGPDILTTMGLKITEITADERNVILGKLEELRDSFVSAWAVRNVKTDAVLTKCLQGAVKPTTELLWHGSRNENWWNIMCAGLVLRPANAVITGKMFGYGTYFANRARKSLGYTSIDGSVWAKGAAPTGLLALYDVHTGRQKHINRREPGMGSLTHDEVSREGFDSVYAHARPGFLFNDEFIVYREEACAIRYLVEVKKAR